MCPVSSHCLSFYCNHLPWLLQSNSGKWEASSGEGRKKDVIFQNLFTRCASLYYIPVWHTFIRILWQFIPLKSVLQLSVILIIILFILFFSCYFALYDVALDSPLTFSCVPLCSCALIQKHFSCQCESIMHMSLIQCHQYLRDHIPIAYK